MTVPWATVAEAAPAPAASPTPEQLYEQGRKEYRLGNFDVAVKKWEQAYADSENPLLLYNISLAYKGKYGISKDIADLRKAKAVLENFITLAEADSDIDLDDAPERLKELDRMISDAEAAARASVPPPEPKVEPLDAPPKNPTPSGDDPGKKLRLAGAVTMGLGGVFIVGGAVTGAVLGVKGRGFADELARLKPEREMACEDVDFPPDDMGNPRGPEDFDTNAEAEAAGLDETQLQCVNATIRVETERDNGRTANLGMAIGLGVGLGLGVVAVVAGAVLFTQGNRRTKEWKQGLARHELRVTPMSSGLGTRRSTFGLAVSGRF